jgi:multidrug resistance efflux pump
MHYAPFISTSPPAKKENNDHMKNTVIVTSTSMFVLVGILIGWYWMTYGMKTKSMKK